MFVLSVSPNQYCEHIGLAGRSICIHQTAHDRRMTATTRTHVNEDVKQQASPCRSHCWCCYLFWGWGRTTQPCYDFVDLSRACLMRIYEHFSVRCYCTSGDRHSEAVENCDLIFYCLCAILEADSQSRNMEAKSVSFSTHFQYLSDGSCS
jgi:hypothetical protein